MSPWRSRLELIALIVVPILLFAPTLWAGFTFDDQHFVLRNPEIRYWHFWDLWSGWTRQARTLTVMLDYSLFELEPWGYHLHNLLWHLAAVLLVFAFLLRLGASRTVAFLAALLFAVHPVHVEAVANVTNRKEMMVLVFSLLAFLGYMRFSSTRQLRWLATALLAWTLAMFSKQVAVVLPLSIAAWELLFLARERRLMWRHPILLALGAALGMGVLLIFLSEDLDFVRVTKIRTLGGYSGETTVFTVALTSARAFWTYVGLLIWPAALCPDHLIELSNRFDAVTTLAWLALLGLALALIPLRRWPLAAFALAWLLVHYLPISNLVPSAYIVADRYLYVPSLGFCLGLVLLLEQLSSTLAARAHLRSAMLLALLALPLSIGYAARTLRYLGPWMNDSLLWEHALVCNPRSYRAHNSLGRYAYKAGRFELAVDHFTAAFERGLSEALCNRGAALERLGRFEEGIRDCSLALQAEPGRADFHYNRGNLYKRSGRLLQALSDYDRAAELRPQHAGTYNNRGRVRLELGRRDEALEDFRRGAALGSAGARAKLAQLEAVR